MSERAHSQEYADPRFPNKRPASESSPFGKMEVQLPEVKSLKQNLAGLKIRENVEELNQNLPRIDALSMPTLELPKLELPSEVPKLTDALPSLPKLEMPAE